MLHVFNQSEIKAIVGITGKQIYDAAELCEKYAELDHKKALRLIKSVGFKKVRYLPFATTTSDACVIGAQKIFKDLNVDPKSIDGLIMVTQCPDYLVPATSYTMQQRLGLNSETLLLDLTQGCTGFVYGLMVANSLIETQVCSNILVCVGDVSQSINLHNGMFLDQKSNLSVFADGAGVALISRNQKANKSSYFSIENNFIFLPLIALHLSEYILQLFYKNPTSSLHARIIIASEIKEIRYAFYLYSLQICPGSR